MTEEPKRRDRPPRHLQDEHHFRTSDDAAAAGAPPAAADSGQADVSDEALASDSASAESIAEAMVENPTVISPTHDIFSSLEIAPQKLESAEQEIVANTLSHESPVEQKIQALMEEKQERIKAELTQLLYSDDLVNGWHPIETEIVLKLPPRNGMPVRLSENADGDGVLAFWKKTRKFANPTLRWQESGYWCDFHNGQKISFDPKYWKERF